MSDKTYTGVVKFFNSKKGYGFVQPDDGGNDVFLHVTEIERAGIDPDSVTKGTEIEYSLVEHRGKECAGKISVL